MSSSLEVTTRLALGGLIGTTVITVIGALQSEDSTFYENKRVALTIESAVNIIASYMYMGIGPLLNNGNIDKANDLRYLDWYLTCPLLIVSFIYYLRSRDSEECDDTEKECDFPWVTALVAITSTLIMLTFGMAGRTRGSANKFSWLAMMGFVAFGGLATSLYVRYPHQLGAISIFLTVWLLYGIVYFLPLNKTVNREAAYNVLDVISKSGFGVFLFFAMNG
tara:strand:- start:2126 stop:2791 length:666 start_codon:yes stop_codon:yes gene_type:complete